jgi:hypothetical protein
VEIKCIRCSNPGSFDALCLHYFLAQTWVVCIPGPQWWQQIIYRYTLICFVLHKHAETLNTILFIISTKCVFWRSANVAFVVAIIKYDGRTSFCRFFLSALVVLNKYKEITHMFSRMMMSQALWTWQSTLVGIRDTCILMASQAASEKNCFPIDVVHLTSYFFQGRPFKAIHVRQPWACFSVRGAFLSFWKGYHFLENYQQIFLFNFCDFMQLWFINDLPGPTFNYMNLGMIACIWWRLEFGLLSTISRNETQRYTGLVELLHKIHEKNSTKGMFSWHFLTQEQHVDPENWKLHFSYALYKL